MSVSKPTFDIETAKQFATEIVQKLQRSGHEALFAGGCVRDELLGKKPKDFDVATSALPEEIRKLFGHKKTLAIGAAFGVITVVGDKRSGNVEVATFREDADYSDGRHPDSVSFTNAQEDAKRRDFTINALFYDPVSAETIDYVDGVRDLEKEEIRAVGNADQRIEEDKLRMLRAVRFAATLNFRIEPNTFSAIQKRASELNVVSAERVSEELRKICSHENRAHGLELLRESSLLKAIFPAIDFNQGIEWPDRLKIIETLAKADLASVLASLFYRTSLNRKSIEALARELKLNNDERKKVVFLVENVESIFAADKAYWPSVQRLLIQPLSRSAVELAQSISAVVNETEFRSGLEFCKAQFLKSEKELNPDPLLDGNDLIQIGIPTGRHFAKLLEAVRDQQLLGKLSRSEDAIDWAQAEWLKMSRE